MDSIFSLYDLTVHVHESGHQCLKPERNIYLIQKKLRTTKEDTNKTHIVFGFDLLVLFGLAFFHAGPFRFTSIMIILACCTRVVDYLVRRYLSFFVTR